MAERSLERKKPKHTGRLEGLSPEELGGTSARVIRIEYVSLDDLADHRADKNAKKHRLDAIDASMRRHGYTAPIMVDEGTQRVVAGHGRIDTLIERRLGGREPPDGVAVRDSVWLVPVVRGIAFKDPTEAMSYLMADNRIQELAGYDWHEMREIAALVADSPEGLGGTGFASMDEIEAQMNREVNEFIDTRSDDEPPRLPDDPDEENMDASDGRSGTALPALRFGNMVFQMSAEDAAELKGHATVHLKENGSYHGFAARLINGL